MHIEYKNDVAILHMNAGKANAIGPAFLDRLDGLFDTLDTSPAKAAVLTGYERFFCAGLDLPALLPLERATLGAFMHQFTRITLRVFMCPRPVVAAINGHAIAGGCVLAMQADYRIMAEGRIGLNEVPLGLGLPAVVTETLAVQVPASSLLPVALEGKLFSAAEAQSLGLVHETVAGDALLARALEKAGELAALPGAAWRQVKQTLRGPVRARVEAARDLEGWLDTFYSAEAQARIADAMARIGSKK